MAMNATSSSSPASNTRTTFGWCSLARARNSRLKPKQAVLLFGRMREQDFERQTRLVSGVDRFVDDTHAARADPAHQLVSTDALESRHRGKVAGSSGEVSRRRAS